MIPSKWISCGNDLFRTELQRVHRRKRAIIALLLAGVVAILLMLALVVATRRTLVMTVTQPDAESNASRNEAEDYERDVLIVYRKDEANCCSDNANPNGTTQWLVHGVITKQQPNAYTNAGKNKA